MRLPLRPSALALIGLGLGMLAVGVWVEDRSAVSAPLVIIGALVVVAGVIFEAWADLEELSVTQSGVTFKRSPPPSAEALTEAGLPPQAAEQLQNWLDGVLAEVPRAVDERARELVLAERRKHILRRLPVREIVWLPRHDAADAPADEPPDS